MAVTKIDAYEVIYSANTFAPRIGLKAGGKYIGQLIFMLNDSKLPADNVQGGQVNLFYHLNNYQHAIDLLRNEGPIYLYFNGSGGGFENGIRTTEEPVGEGEH